MIGFALSPTARAQVDAIFDYTVKRWSDEQAAKYIDELFEEVGKLADRAVLWRRLPAAFEVDGFSRSWRSHVIYWYETPAKQLRIVAVLHAQMDQVSRAREAFGAEDVEE